MYIFSVLHVYTHLDAVHMLDTPKYDESLDYLHLVIYNETLITPA